MRISRHDQFVLCFFFCRAPHFNSFDGGSETNGIRSQLSYYSSSNSNSSSISGSSSESDYRMTVKDGDLDADADSLTCKQSDISSADHLENDHVKSVRNQAHQSANILLLY